MQMLHMQHKLKFCYKINMVANTELKIAIIGGGASGIFAALKAAETAKKNQQKVNICVFEASQSLLKKVRISGGGRCNVTHHEFDSKRFCQNYPRGQKELLSPFQQFQAKDMVEWLNQRGIKLKYESDGRMFPVTDKSQTIIECFLKEADRLKIKILNNTLIEKVSCNSEYEFQLLDRKDETYKAHRLLIATGSLPIGYKLAKSLGHQITELAPSLFSFKIQDIVLEDLSGVSFENANLTLKMEGAKDFKQEGPLLITHWGLSGPALLKLSAWAAREMKQANYHAKLIVNWLNFKNEEITKDFINKLSNENAKALVTNAYPHNLTKRFWKQLLLKSKVDIEKRWAELSKKELNSLIRNLYQCELTVNGKNRYKEEFVECGGVNLKEINFKTMESKICKGLYFTGEVLDIDGITGGFNFQNAWSTGYIAGTDIVNYPTTST